ncbi:unnamed protein product [Auanema sp. JU1783]|nr:unnamed protein product [Auanema sp. JU1783]
MGNTNSGDKLPEEVRRKAKSVSERTPNTTTNGKRLPSSARASMSSQGNRRPILTVNQRSIIKYCLDNAKDDLADRILRRAVEKKDDFKTFMDTLPRTDRTNLSSALRDFLLAVCDNLTDSEEIQRLSEEFGTQFVPYRNYGFKPDFFACTADAVTTECTFLDQATHTASETAGSWSMLTAFVFSAVRDGYYCELRKQRRNSSAFRSRPSVDVSTDGSTGCDRRSRSASPAVDELSHSSETKEPNNYLLPPQVY